MESCCSRAGLGSLWNTHPGKALEYRARVCVSTGQTVPGTPGLYLGQMTGSQDTGFVPGLTWFVPRINGLCPGQFVPRVPGWCRGQFVTRTVCTQNTWLVPWTNGLYSAPLVSTPDSCFILRVTGLYFLHPLHHVLWRTPVPVVMVVESS